MIAQLIDLFDQCFYDRYNTRLIKGDDEPIYIPANKKNQYHQVVFAHGFFSSALHEIAHWSLAGEQRRQLVDYGYWYAADGRNSEQQKVFEQVEVKPQAIEWMFSMASCHSFRVSVDNLNGEYTDPLPFKQSVYAQVQKFCEHGLPERAQIFHNQLIRQFNPGYKLSIDNFSLIQL